MDSPLSGCVVLDFSRLLPGPLGCRFLAEMGAEVIKIEEIKNPDPARLYPPIQEGVSFLYMALNAGKRFIEYDSNNPQDKKALTDLILRADILVEQYKPGTMSKMGLGFEEVSKINPQIIYVSVNGYSADSPQYKKAGHDLNYMAECGALNLLRDGQGHPIVPLFQMADVAGGTYGLVMSVLSALLYRHKTGHGCYIQVPMTEFTRQILFLPMIWSQLHDNLDNFMLNGSLPNYCIYRCKDGFVALGALEPKFWMTFCQAIEKSEWATRLFSDNDGGRSLKNEVSEYLQKLTVEEVVKKCSSTECCVTPMHNSISDYWNNKMFSENSFQIGELNEKPIRIPIFPLNTLTTTLNKNTVKIGRDNIYYGFSQNSEK